MRLWVVLAGVAAIAGCGPATYSEPWPDPIEKAPDAPLSLLRIAPDFRFRDFPTGKEYIFRRFTASMTSEAYRNDRLGGAEGTSITTIASSDMRLEVVTVIDPEQRDERLATAIEKDYALGVLQREWVDRRLDDALAFHRDAVVRERLVKADLIDERIYYHNRVIDDLKEEKFRFECDLVSIKTTENYKATDGRAEYLQDRITRHTVLIADRMAEVELLKIAKFQRDGRLERSSSLVRVREFVSVSDIIGAEMSPDRLISEITQGVHPDAWKDPTAVIRYANGYLELYASRTAIDGVYDHVTRLRERRGR